MYPKIIKLQYLLENSKKKLIKCSNNSLDWTSLISKKNIQKSSNLETDLSLYLSLIDKPINLLFSIDQFFFEFSKKNYQQKQTGEFFQQLKERKKLSLFYGHLTRKQFNNLFDKVKNTKGYFSKNILSLLESRIDVVLYRSGLTKTIAESRQLIKHKKVKINKKTKNIPSYLLSPGDLISLESRNHQFENLEEFRVLKKSEKISSTSDFSKKNIFDQNNLVNSYSNFTKYLDLLLSFKIPNREKFISNSLNSGNSLSFKSSGKKLLQKKGSSDIDSSKTFCKFIIQFLSTQIKSRSYYKLMNDEFNFKNLISFQERCLDNYSKTFRVVFKWKSFYKKKIFLKNKIKTNSLNNHQFYINNLDFLEIGNGYLQKKPLFWNRNLLNLKKKKKFYEKFYKNKDFYLSKKSHLNRQGNKNIYFPEETFYLKKNYFLQNKQVSFFFNKALSQIKNFKQDPKNLRKYNNLLYRKSFVVFLKNLNNSKKFTNLIPLNLIKFLFKKSISKTNSLFSQNFSFKLIRPLNFEISYNLLNLVYLYSPQRINYPFSIDLDLIKRSLR